MLNDTVWTYTGWLQSRPWVPCICATMLVLATFWGCSLQEEPTPAPTTTRTFTRPAPGPTTTPTPTLVGSCRVGMRLDQGEACHVSGSKTTFFVDWEGLGCISVEEGGAPVTREFSGNVLGLPLSGTLNIAGGGVVCQGGQMDLSSVVYAEERSGGKWEIDNVGAGPGPRPTPKSTPEPTSILPSAPSVSAGWFHACTLKTDASIECVGSDGYGEATPPAGRFTDVSVGGRHSCGLKSNGQVVCWGDDGFNRATDSPSGRFVAISAGYEYTCGVKTDETLTCWGNDREGQAMPPPGSFRSVSAGRYLSGAHTCGIRTDGSVECWGRDDYGEGTPPEGSFESVSAGMWFTCGVKTDRSIACWGLNVHGETEPPDGSFISVSAGGGHACGIAIDNSLVCWGDDTYGQATTPPGSFASVSASGGQTCTVETGGAIRCWGNYGYGKSSGPRPTLEAPSELLPTTTPMPTTPAVSANGSGPPALPPTDTSGGEITRSIFEAATPAGYARVTLREHGTVWGVPDRYTDDSEHGAVAYMLLGTLRGCDFANQELDLGSTVYIKVERLGRLNGYQSAQVCRKDSRTWDSWDGLRITHLRFFDRGSADNVREYAYDSAAGRYVELDGQ